MGNVPSVLRALETALRTADWVTEEDRTTVALAKRYAALIDETALAEAYREPLRKLRMMVDLDAPALDKHLAKVEAALSAHTVASDLGPKLLAALAELRMTPKARQAIVKGGQGDGGNTASGGGKVVQRTKLEQLRDQHDARRRADRA